MSLKWTGTHSQSETGILRKSEFKEKKEELFVFGYSCKLFRDDAKALHIDQGKHLIPWMGDETLKIDRYDARGALHDLTNHEAPQGGFDWRVELTKLEQEIEQLCDEERYRALHTDEEEEMMLHKAGYGQVGFNYDTPAEPSVTQPADVDEEPFVPTPVFKDLMPVDIVFVSIVHYYLTKTSVNYGAQMEILIKAKQRDNPQFKFLNKDDPLHPYYTALTALAPSIPSIHYRPSADCDYTMLISKMRGDGDLAPGELPPPGTEPTTAPAPAGQYMAALAPPQPLQPLQSTGLSLMKNYDSGDESNQSDIVRAKNDPRFTFLEPSNVYHAYYNRLMQEKRGVDENGRSEKRNKVKAIEPLKFLTKPAIAELKNPIENVYEKQIETEVKKLEAIEYKADKIEVKTYDVQNYEKIDSKEENIEDDKEILKEREESKEPSPVRERKVEKPRENDRNSPDKRREKKRQKGEYRSKSESREYKRSKSSEREKRREKDRERHKKRRRIDKDDLESEIISLVDNSDDLIDLTGDQSDSKGKYG
ncbi:Protein suppressor of white apricot [Operophtera brumata]|uniref:Protein suppressor of white apricot n=1 Tax=Operophtera brumata TaxID=104452 RepID=A0A0L7LIN6_OPEBR|nr:Protein suppressor of white apricot [Operophtera brumata]